MKYQDLSFYYKIIYSPRAVTEHIIFIFHTWEYGFRHGNELD